MGFSSLASPRSTLTSPSMTAGDGVQLEATVAQPAAITAAGALSWTITATGGTGSYTYSAGSLTKPAGSSASVSGGTSSTPSLTADKIGAYSFVVTVTSGSESIDVNCHGSFRMASAFTAADPNAQLLAAGTTSGSITFASPSGGSGAYTVTAGPTVTHRSGSGAGVSGTPPGSISVTSLEDGDCVEVATTYTDTASGQTATSTAVISVGGGPPVWQTLGTYDFTADITAGSNTASSGSFDVLAGNGVTVKATFEIAASGGTAYSTTWDTGGLLVALTASAGAGAFYHLGIDTSALSGVDYSKPVLIEAIFDSIDLPSDADGTRGGLWVSPTNMTIDEGTSRAGWYDAASEARFAQAWSDGSTSTIDSATATHPSTGRVQCQMIGRDVRWSVSDATTVAGYFDTATGTLFGFADAGSVANPPTRLPAALRVGVAIFAKFTGTSTVRLKRLVVYQASGVAS